MKKFETKYGYFSKDGLEYNIKTYKTPKPWVHVVSNGTYGFVVSQSGGGFSWNTHSEFNRLNRWHQDLIKDDWGKFIYVVDNISGERWSPTWMPLKTNLDKYKVIYGAGYAKFLSKYKNIEIELTMFVPFDDNIEIWDLQIKNLGKEKTDISIYTYFEWCLGSSSDFHREFHKVFIETEFSQPMNTMFAGKRVWDIPLGEKGHWNIAYPNKGFITANKKISTYTSDKEEFIGRMGETSNPIGLSKKKLANSIGKVNDPVAVIKINLKIDSGKSDNVDIITGLASKKEDVVEYRNKYFKDKVIAEALEKVKLKWSKMLSPLEIKTPDESMNIMVNFWLRYQTIVGRLWARTAYYQQSGAFGFRDQLQDSLVFLTINPEKTAEQIRLHARFQKEDGSVLHWWHPITDTGLETEMTDDLLWLPFITEKYIEETNDYRLLDKIEPFYNSTKSGTIFEHCIRAINKVQSRFSKRGLPLIGAGDWNDGLSAVGLQNKGESIWLAQFLYSILTRFSVVANNYGKKEISTELLESAKSLKKSFNKYAWDGEWYYRGTKDSGEKFGSKINKDGKIFLNPQTWSVLSGIATPKKQKLAMDSVKKYLLKKNGALLLQPAYHTPDENIGYLSRYAPGKRENGGVYTHAATWAILAFALMKDKKSAFLAYEGINPILNGMNPDEYQAEPYVTPGNIDGPDSEKYGLGGWTWYTGSSSWLQRVIIEGLLGVRIQKNKLIIEPLVPTSWKSFSIKRMFRGTLYDIEAIQMKKKEKPYMLIDGKKYSSNVIPKITSDYVKIKYHF